jgi:hypothetical protein
VPPPDAAPPRRLTKTLYAEGKMLNRDLAIKFAVSLVAGGAIWALLSVATGYPEPWDADSPYYFVSLFVMGALLGWLYPRNVWTVFLGIVFGQLIYMLVFLPSGPLLPLGIIFLFTFSVLSLAGAAITSRIRRRLESIKSRNGHGI